MLALIPMRELSKAAQPARELPVPVSMPSPAFRDDVQSVTRQPPLVRIPSDELVRAEHSATKLPSPTINPEPLFRDAFRLLSWLLTAAVASTPSPPQLRSEPLRITT